MTPICVNLARYCKINLIRMNLARSCKITLIRMILARSCKITLIRINLAWSCKMTLICMNLARSCEITLICMNLTRSCKITLICMNLARSCKIFSLDQLGQHFLQNYHELDSPDNKLYIFGFNPPFRQAPTWNCIFLILAPLFVHGKFEFWGYKPP